MRLNGIREADVAVLGGGPAGAAIALELAKRGHSTIALERSDYRGVRIGETLPPAVQPLLVGLGIWDRFLAQKHSRSFGICSAWGHDDLYDNDFIFNPYGAGWHVDRVHLDAMLARCAEEAGASVYRRARLLFCEYANRGWQIDVACDDGKRRFRTKLLVDATGRASYAARGQGAKRVSCDRLIWVFFFFSSRSKKSASDDSTLIEAVEDGWWYSAALPDARLVLAYMTDADLYASARTPSNSSCLRQLQKARHTKSRVEPYVLTSGPLVVPANSSRLDRATNGSWLAIGDAAMAFDPLSGQGVYKALHSALRAAESINQHWAGNTSALPDYAVAAGEDFDRYLLTRRAVYSREQRWPRSTFWQRRLSDRIPAEPMPRRGAHPT